MTVKPSNSAAAPAVARDPRRWLTLIAMTGSLSMVLLDETVVGYSLGGDDRNRIG